MISQEKRKLISDAHKEGMSVKEMSRVYRVPERSIRGLLIHERKTGSMEVDTSTWGRPSALDEGELEKMKALIEERPDITLEEIKEAMGLSICISAICRIVRNKLGFTYKKNFARKRAGQRKKQENPQRVFAEPKRTADKPSGFH